MHTWSIANNQAKPPIGHHILAEDRYVRSVLSGGIVFNGISAYFDMHLFSVLAVLLT